MCYGIYEEATPAVKSVEIPVRRIVRLNLLQGFVNSGCPLLTNSFSPVRGAKVRRCNAQLRAKFRFFRFVPAMSFSIVRDNHERALRASHKRAILSILWTPRAAFPAPGHSCRNRKKSQDRAVNVVNSLILSGIFYPEGSPAA